MKVNMLKGKIHRATVVQAELNYVGSITVDEDLLDAAGIYEYEKVHIVDIDNGARFETYMKIKLVELLIMKNTDNYLNKKIKLIY